MRIHLKFPAFILFIVLFSSLNGFMVQIPSQKRFFLSQLQLRARPKHLSKSSSGEVEDLISAIVASEKSTDISTNVSVPFGQEDTDTILFPEMEQMGIDERKIRASPFGKVVFGLLDTLFPVFKEPNWFDIYDPPLNSEENMELPYFDGYDFVNRFVTFE